MLKDFLDNEIEVGDLVIYTPSAHGNELVLAEVLELKEYVKDIWGYGDSGKYEIVGADTGYSPVLQPIKSTSSYRTKAWKNGEYVPAIPRKVMLQDGSGMTLHKKKEN